MVFWQMDVVIQEKWAPDPHVSGPLLGEHHTLTLVKSVSKMASFATKMANHPPTWSESAHITFSDLANRYGVRPQSASERPTKQCADGYEVPFSVLPQMDRQPITVARRHPNA
jgi:hypothetical protein